MKAHERLAQQRKASGLTQQKMADRLKITLRHYCGLEAGDRTPSLRLAGDIRAEFGVPMADWISSKGGVSGFAEPQ